MEPEEEYELVVDGFCVDDVHDSARAARRRILECYDRHKHEEKEVYIFQVFRTYTEVDPGDIR